ncbi:MAG: aspartate-semialdehyde dehydrogenase [SAR202 cluster bacterium]|nr:aspartate-semialdehyde dehydrogenase [SAR202 cluster bacterium]
MTNRKNIAVVGATGAVGTVFLEMLEERKFPVADLRLCASERSLGKRITVNGDQIEVELLSSELVEKVDMVFVSASSDISHLAASMIGDTNTILIDDSSAFRMDPDVPLIVPEVNSEALKDVKNIISIPNCSTTPLVMALKPLHDNFSLKRVIVDTYQSVSGTGSAALDELKTQTKQYLDNDSIQADVYPHQIAFNVLPHIEPFLPNGYTREEMKMLNETRKILNIPDLNLSATCARVPVMIGHSEAVHAEFHNPIDLEKSVELLRGFPGIRVVDDPISAMYPMPIDSEGDDDVLVGRIRNDMSCDNSIAFWLASDNLRKGAALNAIQIAEEILRRKIH